MASTTTPRTRSASGWRSTTASYDDGVPYDPLQAAEPDVTASLDERSIGGLGILLVKKMMDTVTYERAGGRNVLRMRKRLPAPV
jgi:anti-sigma regulatory factor (Ser/Thr protein kinase)